MVVCGVAFSRSRMVAVGGRHEPGIGGLRRRTPDPRRSGLPATRLPSPRWSWTPIRGASCTLRTKTPLRHPASITKVMTLYLLFEQMERGRMRLDTPIPISARAASMPPTKVGLRPGSTITVENAIGSLVTKSANDIAVAVAEAIAGDEETFARLMTRKAQSLGMTRTVFRNASGLPNDEQVTTARDLTILGRAIQDRFPRQFAYFSKTEHRMGSVVMRNHNRLLGRLEYVDGIKTGYIRASGFNVLTSAKLDGRRVVAVVMGGRTAAHRDGIMANLDREHDRTGRPHADRRADHRRARRSRASPTPARRLLRRLRPLLPRRPAGRAPGRRRRAARAPDRADSYAPVESARPAVVSAGPRDEVLHRLDPRRHAEHDFRRSPPGRRLRPRPRPFAGRRDRAASARPRRRRRTR